MAVCAMLLIFGFGLALIAYSTIASDLPVQASDLRNRASAFQSTRFLDRNGNLLNEIFNPDKGRRTEVPLDRIPLDLRNATIAVEDANFYQHQGIDFYALARALYYAVSEGDLVSGGSTIPQQLVKLTLLSPERTVTRKVREAILAAEISRSYSKEQILQIYLNELFYGNFAYGIDAAAETYFKKDVSQLTLAQAALLAGLPQAPAYYDPYNFPDSAKKRQGVVLRLMVENGMLSKEQADAAWLEPLNYEPLKFDFNAPHFTLFARQQMEEISIQRFGSQDALYQKGLKVYTTLDMTLQDEAQRIVAEQVAALAGNNVSNGALVAVDPRSGEILAMIGSADFYNVEIDGQVNMALAPRQPGSTIKPLVYLASFEQPGKALQERWTPGALTADIGEAFPDGTNPPYAPTDYDKKERGLVTVRTALANSLNIPAVRALQTVGLPAFLELAQRLGISTLTRPDYGLSLSLGAGEAPLLEMTGAFAVLANGGVRKPLATVRKIVGADGTVFCELGTENPCQGEAGSGQQVISAVDAFLITDILSDNEARSLIFGSNSLLRLNRPAAAKTGTTNDIRDILTIGYTPQLVTGVWVGNNDNTPMLNVSGVSGAAPIWNQFMNSALAEQPVLEFTPPPGVKQFEVCADTGAQASEACPEKRLRWYAEDRPPLPADKDLYQKIKLDKSSGRLANQFTPADQVEERVFKVYPEAYRKWAEEHGIPQPPQNPNESVQTAFDLVVRSPYEGETVGQFVTVIGSANLANLAAWELQYGVSHDPGAFSAPFSGPFEQPVIDGVLGEWNTTGLGDGPHTLRLLARDRDGSQYETRVRVFVAQPTATAEIILTPTWTPELTPSETPTFAPTLVNEPTASETLILAPAATDTPIPLEITVTDTPVTEPSPTKTLLPIETPTETPVAG
jgi:penicillin-binding protein 1C